ncbi:class I SAM-dependent methyltransferase [Microbacterium sp. SORGH_AS_0888]|uniref:class I SAM-dependent methyltransferase n=1 Tax=Microbacterium sp. SORGH_AS_0888 TaxID=3041791 RepID=UPI002781C9E6|nr:class I SAM-dependent methyltransferase [Microbacterium sp. SORGH_AS_0888]MDQ1130108.1 SAM-dependent methyltransferase [Microbacterium sp. SORGH_AS_0888]
MTDVTTAYADRAAEYAEALGSMDAVHPSDRQLVETWAANAPGRLLDAGCGPGHWTHHLCGRGADVRGVDAVAEFVAHARARYAGTRFDLESIEALSDADGALGGILSWFSTIHHAPAQIAAPLAEFARVLRPSGLLLLGHFHGERVESFDHAVVRAYRWPTAELTGVVESAGFATVETHLRTERGRRPVGAILCERV